eukprot:scaffold27896_cov49-Phaeocystis_antarctica.AAC.1
MYLLRTDHARRCASPASAASCVGSAPRSNMTKHHHPPPPPQPPPQPQPQTLQPPPPPPPQPPPPPLARPSRLQRCSPDRGTRRVAKEPRSPPPPLSRGRVGPCRRCGGAVGGRHHSGHSSRHRWRCRPRSARCWRRTSPRLERPCWLSPPCTRCAMRPMRPWAPCDAHSTDAPCDAPCGALCDGAQQNG